MLALIGSSYRQAPLPSLAQLAESATLRAALERLRQGDDPVARGFVTLATCNRFEIYLDTPRPGEAIAAVTAAAGSAHAPATAPSVATPPMAALTAHTGPAVARHLFRVTSGLDSMVVGESEISGQVAAALQAARKAATTTAALNLLFQTAARTAKRVATETQLGAAGRSIAAVALDAAERRIGPLDRAAVLLVGTGSYGRVIAAALKARRCGEALVFSPSGRHVAFAADRGMTPVDAAALRQVLGRVDLVVTASGTGTVVLTPELARDVAAGRDKPITVIDLAVRGDVPAETRAVAGIDVIDLAALAAPSGDDAATIAANTVTAGADATIADAEALVAHALDGFNARTAERRLDPAVVALRHHITDTIDREMSQLLPRLPAESAHDVERSLHRIARSLLHTPTAQAHALAREGLGAQYIAALRTLFAIDAPPVGTRTGGS